MTRALSGQQMGALRRRLVDELGAAAVLTELRAGMPQQVTHVILDSRRLDPAALTELAQTLQPALQAIQGAHPGLALTPLELRSRMRAVDEGWLWEVLRHGRQAGGGEDGGQGGNDGEGDGGGGAALLGRGRRRNAALTCGGADGGGGSDGGGFDGASSRGPAAKASNGRWELETTARVPRQPSPRPGPLPAPDAPLARFASWLGEWHEALDGVAKQSELVLYGVYDKDRCVAYGNGALDAALRELVSYEEALAGPRGGPASPLPRPSGAPPAPSDNTDVERFEGHRPHPSTTAPFGIGRGGRGGVAATAAAAGDGAGSPPGVRPAAAGSGLINHQALNYAHAAAVVRAAAFPINPDLPPERLQQLLPFVGPFTARVIHELAASVHAAAAAGGGAELAALARCGPLDAFRADQPARDSRGRLRRGTEGASTRRMFCSLPGCGPALARHWWEAGFRTFEELLAEGEAQRRVEGLPVEGPPRPVGGRGRQRELKQGEGADEDEAGAGAGLAAELEGGFETPPREGEGAEGGGLTQRAGRRRRRQHGADDGGGGGGGVKALGSRSKRPRRALFPEGAAEGETEAEADTEAEAGQLPAGSAEAVEEHGDGGGDGGDGGQPLDAAAAYARRGGRHSSRGGGAGGLAGWWRGEVWYSLVWREQLAEAVTEAEVAEMRRALLNLLASETGAPGWLLLQAGER
ncbi:hypothetical protein GPECTOR_68g368 [Gonium pectorale]|uniref:Uncharacterized protein n=1 Tax=Gonium pectorale TaxID=33097 RepID=A0A150G3H1_GONPE|nr:hypothetical protein GPECTOR_68g368 [Gonium pectorale]|eukprot:KXZ44397.1 hypothetical protein GPECTOR_68g368 [Gonium pectorale]